jgi:hypothetical protein
MTPTDYRKALNALGLSPDEMAERLRLHRTKIYKRLAGKTAVPYAEIIAIRLMLTHPNIWRKLTREKGGRRVAKSTAAR